MPRVADTSALYAVFDSDDKHHDEAREILGDPTPVEIPSEILVETVNLLGYRFTWENACRALESLLAKPHISVAQPIPFGGVREVFQAAQGTLSLADAVVVQTVRALGAEAWTYDGEIKARVG